MEYAIEMSVTSCVYPCTVVLWVDVSELTFSNFGDIPEPVRDGVCPVERPSSYQVPNTTIQETSRSFEKRNGSFDDLGNCADFGGGKNNVTENFASDMTEGDDKIVEISIWVVVRGALIVLVFAAVGVYRYTKRRNSERRKVDKDSPETNKSSSSSSELNTMDYFRAEGTSSSGEDLESVRYQTLDEVVEKVEHPPHIDVLDDQDYTYISDYDTDCHHSDECQISKALRPLPKPPKSRSGTKSIPSECSVETSGVYYLSSITSTSDTSPDASFLRPPTLDPDSTQPSNQRLQPLFKPHCQAETTKSMAFPSVLPRPHKRLVDLKDHKYMGLVKLRQDQAVFGDVTEVKLIRTLTGHLELINAEEELPAFNEYYARLLLINQTGGSLGVVGVRDTEDKPTGDSCKRPEPGIDSPVMASTSKNEQARHLNTMDKEKPYIIYFGACIEHEGKCQHQPQRLPDSAR